MGSFGAVERNLRSGKSAALTIAVGSGVPDDERAVEVGSFELDEAGDDEGFAGDVEAKNVISKLCIIGEVFAVTKTRCWR